MKSAKSVFLLCLPFVVLSATLAIAQSPVRVASPPQSAQVIKNYKKLTCLTPEGVYMDPDLIGLCIGASSQQVVAAEKENGPHAFGRMKVYMNDLAKRALQSKSKAFPVGAVVVKEKFIAYKANAFEVLGPEKGKERPTGVTGMIKRAPGYDLQNGDWEYFIQEEGSKPETGKITTCVSCHQKAKGPDHLFATWYGKKPVR